MAGLWSCVACDVTNVPALSSAHLLAGGDIASCESDGDEATAKLLDTLPGTIVTLGDNVYPLSADPASSESSYSQCFAPTWGRHKARIRPVPGNHDYENEKSTNDYYTYFGAAAGSSGNGYYSFDLAKWHLVALNNEISMASNSAQLQWLTADLAAASQRCVLVYWHEPRFSSGPHGDLPGLQLLWQILYDSKVDVVLNGHDHDYERFALQTPAGVPDPASGIREFVVGTGGSSHYEFVTVRANSEFRLAGTYGVLRLVLSDGNYHWDFIGVQGNVLDSGDGQCH
jgi:hypothetical protein